MLFAHPLVKATLAVGSKIAVLDLVAIQTLVTTSTEMLKNDERKSRKSVICTSLGATPVAALTEFL